MLENQQLTDSWSVLSANGIPLSEHNSLAGEVTGLTSHGIKCTTFQHTNLHMRLNSKNISLDAAGDGKATSLDQAEPVLQKSSALPL